jgi:integrase
MRKANGPPDGWVFPADTKSGHMEASTIKKQHAHAVTISGVVPFGLYTLRHTCITRRAAYSGRCRSPFRGDGDRDSELMPITIPR